MQGWLMKEPAKSRFRHVIVVVNPKSTHAARAAGYIATLRKLYHSTPVTILETSSAGWQANQALLKQQAIGADTLLCVVAGDGTASMAVETLVQLGDQRPGILLPLWGGNANDLATMLNGTARRGRLAAILQTGKAVAIHPLRCVLLDKHGNSSTHLAACYATFGATAFAAHEFSKPKYRNSRLHTFPWFGFVYEMIVSALVLRRAPQFRIDQDGRQSLTYEQLFTNGPRMAKVNWMSVRLNDTSFLQSRVERKRLTSVLFHLRRLHWQHTHSETVGKCTAFTVLDATWAQFDGEVVHIAAGTRITVDLSPQPFYALSTKLQS